jgi:hypothetical protein
MLDTYKQIIEIYSDLALRGINLISIFLTILIVHILKRIFANLNFYTKKSKAIINLSTGFIISIAFAFILYYDDLSVINIFLTGFIGAGLSVYSNEILSAIKKAVKKHE